MADPTACRKPRQPPSRPGIRLPSRHGASATAHRSDLLLSRDVSTSQVALITGASGGLGSVVTPMFREAGYRVSAVALDWKDPSPAAESELVLQADLAARSEAD